MDVFADGSPFPVPDRDSEPFWDACRQRRLLVRSCNRCGRAHYPPGPVCPWCVSFDVAWAEDGGHGRVRSFVTFRHPFLPALRDALPYVLLKVALDEHPDAVLHGRLVPGPTDAVAVGAPVRVEWEEIGGGYVIPNWSMAANG